MRQSKITPPFVPARTLQNRAAEKQKEYFGPRSFYKHATPTGFKPLAALKRL